ncbi:MAG: iron-sulfur cluster repair di-iron protein [Candidatus Sericytochromatia bacterium]|nr:iron-sulfur cluster repair di-iron protein [Candidatus Tanganyikabacteria bacterium]
MTLTIDTPLGQIAAAAPTSIAVLERHALDYCCGGKRSLAAACRDRGLDPASVLAEIEAGGSGLPAAADETDWSARPMTDLVNHLLETHHVYLKQNLDRLAQLAAKVASVHGENHPEMRQVRDVYGKLHAEMEPHLMKEEQILFPAILRLERDQLTPPLTGRIAVMEAEHDEVGRDLAALRELTAGYAIPDDACMSYRMLLTGLAELERDTLAHVHKENNLLFPRVLAATTKE